jgi:hypothetical protein
MVLPMVLLLNTQHMNVSLSIQDSHLISICLIFLIPIHNISVQYSRTLQFIYIVIDSLN